MLTAGNRQNETGKPMTTAGNRQIEIRETGTGGPVIFWMMFPFRENEADHLWDCLLQMLPDQAFALAVCPVDDWNRDLSPWPAEAVMGEEPFAGEAETTLRWLEEECVPAVMRELESPHPDPESAPCGPNSKQQKENRRKKILAGYSLAGLFTLWDAYETGAFDGYVCCSGSLWFNGWEQYVRNHSIPSACSIYLSLGGKEEKTANPIMATIGNATRTQEKLLRAEPKVRDIMLEMNSGGHFADSGKRLAKGIRWMLEYL